jgi:hypothetical protein
VRRTYASRSVIRGLLCCRHACIEKLFAAERRRGEKRSEIRETEEDEGSEREKGNR